MHVKQEIQRMQVQIHLQRARGDLQTTSLVYGGNGWVRKNEGFGEQMTVRRDGGY